MCIRDRLILARKRCPTLPTIKALDIVSPVLMAAWGVGRLLGPQLMVAGGGHPTSQWFGMYYAGEAGKRLPVPIFQSIESFIIWGILIPVSYTHLDVYKRQPLYLSMFRENISLGSIGGMCAARQTLAGFPYFAVCLLYTSRCV